jgi:putative methyltransferase (TIGR04325 family)
LIGPYLSWQDAVTASDGWDAPEIMDKTLDVSLRLRDGDIAFQQDTIVHDRIIYSETILAFIAMIAGRNCGRIDIVDFAGSLGTNFMQNKKILEPFIKEAKCSWKIIERKIVVDLGREHF